MNKIILSIMINALISIVYYYSISFLFKISGNYYGRQLLEIMCLGMISLWFLTFVLIIIYGISRNRLVGYISMLCFFMYSPIGLIGVYGVKEEMYMEYKKKILKSCDYQIL